MRIPVSSQSTEILPIRRIDSRDTWIVGMMTCQAVMQRGIEGEEEGGEARMSELTRRFQRIDHRRLSLNSPISLSKDVLRGPQVSSDDLRWNVFIETI